MPRKTPTFFKLLRQKWRLFLLTILISISASTLTYFIIKDTLDKTTEHQALIIAEIVARQAAAGRSVYSTQVVRKLVKDGFGAHIDNENKAGFVPLPAQFLKLMGQEATKSSSDLYRYKPISKWHLEPTQGLTDHFENWAWQQLEAQDQSNPTGPIDWQPAWWTEEWHGQRYFRYLRADPASSPSCVSCHNDYLQRTEIKNQLRSEGVSEKKSWKLHQLMGAISVTIPLEKIEKIAIDEIRQTIVWTSTILITALIIIGGMMLAYSQHGNGGQKLTREETHDPDTGLLNLTGLELSLSDALESAKQDNLQHAFICVKLIDTHSIRDFYGIGTYNKFRKRLGNNIADTLRHNDVIGWLGIDKLGVLVNECQDQQARKIIDQIRNVAVNTRAKKSGVELSIDVTVTLTMINAETISVSSILKSTDRIDHEAVSTLA